MKRFLTVFLLVVLSSVVAFAQTTGRLSGTISGPDGALPGATVTATDTKTGKELTVTTNEEGFYRFPQLEFGTYNIRITASGFKTLVANEQKIDVGREATLSPTLQIGDVTAEVVITAGADVVTSTTAQISNTVSPQQILSLPMVTRNPLTLAAGEAGVSANTAQNTTINGMRTTFTNITRDGINIQDTFIRSNATDFAARTSLCRRYWRIHDHNIESRSRPRLRWSPDPFGDAARHQGPSWRVVRIQPQLGVCC